MLYEVITVFEDARTCPVDVGTVLEDDVDEAQTKE